MSNTFFIDVLITDWPHVGQTRTAKGLNVAHGLHLSRSNKHLIFSNCEAYVQTGFCPQSSFVRIPEIPNIQVFFIATITKKSMKSSRNWFHLCVSNNCASDLLRSSHPLWTDLHWKPTRCAIFKGKTSLIWCIVWNADGGKLLQFWKQPSQVIPF